MKAAPKDKLSPRDSASLVIPEIIIRTSCPVRRTLPGKAYGFNSIGYHAPTLVGGSPERGL